MGVAESGGICLVSTLFANCTPVRLVKFFVARLKAVCTAYPKFLPRLKIDTVGWVRSLWFASAACLPLLSLSAFANVVRSSSAQVI